MKILCVVGTRPEAIKMAPIILALRDTPWAHVCVLATAQHRELLDEALAIFGITPDIDLNVMQPAQQLSELTAILLMRLDAVLEKEKPDWVLAQGDTTTVLAVALACFYRRIRFAHVEAGLRTHDLQNPFPEEMNRTLAGHLAQLHFAPTPAARANLLAEGINDAHIVVTGNTVIDALLSVANRDDLPTQNLPANKKIILLTAHRRENFGEPLLAICEAVRTLVKQYDDIHIVYPVHPNPNIHDVVYKELADLHGVTLCAPLDYLHLVAVLQQAWIVLTDSGGLQEEAPALGKPVLVMRSETERPEAVACGVAKIVGSCAKRIVEAVTALRDPTMYAKMAVGASPYGDGKAAIKILEAIKNSRL